MKWLFKPPSFGMTSLHDSNWYNIHDGACLNQLVVWWLLKGNFHFVSLILLWLLGISPYCQLPRILLGIASAYHIISPVKGPPS